MLTRPLTRDKDLVGYWPKYRIVDHDPKTVWFKGSEPLLLPIQPDFKFKARVI